jgi:glycosyltransferase involved in cell wall biosynthesis
MKVTVIIPARNEPYLGKTVQDILNNATSEIEVVCVLDGYWPDVKDISTDNRVRYLHYPESKGMRNGINVAASLAKGEYIMKCDAHCMFAKGFDEELIKSCKDNWVVVPRRYPLDVEKWKIEERTDNKYPIDYEAIDPDDLHGVEWRSRRDERKDIMIDETMTAQGSCWFMKKSHFEFIEGLDEASYGSFFLEFQEISFKTWLSGGKVMVNKNTWYAHYHKVKGRGYSLRPGERDASVAFIKNWKENKAWHKQTIPFEDMINRFKPIPGWK